MMTDAENYNRIEGITSTKDLEALDKATRSILKTLTEDGYAAEEVYWYLENRIQKITEESR